MESTPVIMINIRMIRKLRNILQVQGWFLCITDPMCHIFLETWGKLQYIGGDSRYHDHHQDDQKHPPNTRVLVKTKNGQKSKVVKNQKWSESKSGKKAKVVRKQKWSEKKWSESKSGQKALALALALALAKLNQTELSTVEF